MEAITIDKKRYVLLKQDEYNLLREKAARKITSSRKLSLEEGKKMAFSLVEKWHKGK